MSPTRKNLIIIFVLLLIVAFAVLRTQSSKGSAPIPPLVFHDNITPVSSSEAGLVSQYQSPDLGVEFTFLSPPESPVYATRSANVICLTSSPADVTCEKGDSVQVLKKNPGKSLTAEIQSTVLNGIPESECFVEPYDLQPDPSLPFERVEIRSANDKPLHCLEQMVRVKSKRMYAMDKKHTGRYLFFILGNNPALSKEKGVPWYDALEVQK